MKSTAGGSRETKGRSKLSVKAPRSPASTTPDLGEAPLDCSRFHIVLLVEADSRLSPYVHHINDQPNEESYHVLNDKRIMTSLRKKEASRVSRSDANDPTSLRGRESSVAMDQNLSVETARELTGAIKAELVRMQRGRSHTTDTPAPAMSDPGRKGMASAEFGKKNAEPGEFFVLISSMHNPYLPKLLLEAGIPVQAIVRLDDNEEFSQQKGYKRFYDNFVKKYRFQKELKRAVKDSGDSRDFTKQLSEDIRTFWTTLASLRNEHPKTFRNTIFIDNVLPFVELKPDPATFRAMIETYRTRLHEDTRNVLDSVRNIDHAHQCYQKGKDVQNMRTLHKWDLDALTEYRVSLLMAGYSVPCIVEGILQQVLYIIKEKKHAELTRDFSDSSEVALDPEKALEKNKKVYEVATFLLAMTDRLDDYFVLDNYCSTSKTLHARDEAQLSFLLKETTRETLNTTLQLFRTFAEVLTRNYFLNPNEIVRRATALMSEKLKDCPVRKNGAKFDYVRHNVADAVTHKEFYLSYYLSMLELDALKSEREMKFLERSDIVDDLGYLIRQNLSFALDKDEQSHIYSEDKLDRLLNIQEYGSELRENEISEQGREPLALLDLKGTVEHFKEKFSKGVNLESLCKVYNHVENLAPDSMVQMLFNYVTNADRVSLTRLPLTDDVLIHCWNNTQHATNWTFIIPTILGLHDFYHHLVENTPTDDAIGDLLTCPKPRTPSECSTNYCENETFILPDSIKHERRLNPVYSTEGSSEETEANSISTEEETGNRDMKPPLKQLYYKYGVPQMIENSGSAVTHSFDENLTLQIEKNYWTYKNIENVTVACRIRSHISDLTERNDHLVYYHTKIDMIQNRLISLDFHIHLNTNIRIGFKKKTKYVQLDLDTKISNENNYSVASTRTIPDQQLSDPPFESTVGPVIIYEQGVGLQHKFADTEFDYYPVITCGTGLNVDVSTASALYIQQYYTERDVLPGSVRKYLMNASVVVNDPTRDQVLTMTATGETILLDKSGSINVDGKSDETFRMVTPDGDVYEVQDGMKTLQESSSKLKVTHREHPEKNSLELTREDGLSMHFCDDGTLHVVHPDGTRFTTVVKETVAMVTDFNSGEVTMETEFEEWILVDIFVEISHVNYFPIVYNFREATIMIYGPNGMELSLLTNGTQKFRADERCYFTAGSEGINWEVDRGIIQFKLSAKSPDSTLVTLTNDRETIKVDSGGNLRTFLNWSEVYENELSADMLSNNGWSLNSPNTLTRYPMKTQSENSLRGGVKNCYSNSFVHNLLTGDVNDPFSNSKFIVLSSDFSGFEILPTKFTLTKVKMCQNAPDETIVVQELDNLHPYYCKLLLQALPRASRYGRQFKAKVENSYGLVFQNSDFLNAEMGTEVGDIFCNKQKRLPSTYGPNWSFPFYLKQAKPCPLLTHNIVYRLFHRVNRTGHEILEFFSQALRDSSKLEKYVTGISRNDIFSEEDDGMHYCHTSLSDDGIGERFCLGNMPLICVDQDDIDTIRTFVHEMIRRAALLGTISWVDEEKRRLMGILSKRAEFFRKRQERLSKPSKVEGRDIKQKSCSFQRFCC